MRMWPALLCCWRLSDRGAESGPGDRSGAGCGRRYFPRAWRCNCFRKRGSAELEAWSLKKEAAYFREVASSRTLGRGRIERTNDARLHQPLQRGGAALHGQAGERSFTNTYARTVGFADWGANERAHERRDVGVVADDEQVFVLRALTQQALELLQRGSGRERV